MRVLVACEFSGVVRDSFRRAGHAAWSCDFEEPEGEFKQFHFRCDVREVLNFGWDLMIAHPPCQFLANSGAKHLYIGGKLANGRYEPRWRGLEEGAAFFNLLLEAPIDKICVENPVQHPHARKLIKKWTQTVQPWQFGHGEVKRTCFWLKNLPKLVATNVVEGREARIHKMGPSKTRSADRARTFQGIGDAFVAQWGSLVA